MDLTRGERIILWLAAHSPRFLLEQPERVLINVACLLVGVLTVVPPPPTNVLASFPDLGRTVLGCVMIIGASISVYGSVFYNRQADRFGALALGMSSLFLGSLLIGTVGLRGMITGTIFMAIFVAKAFRFLRATAAQIRVRRHLISEAEKQEIPL
jgi:hypothetical protein